MIVVDSVTKVYRGRGGDVTALDDVSLTINAGEIYGILGRSGAGKTTLLRCLSLLEKPTSGTITVDDLELVGLAGKELRQARHRIGIVFQHFNLFHARTAAANIAFPLEVTGVPKAERDARVAELLALVGLSDRGKSFPSQLSGGQKQRVGIARALAAHPSMLLCDEATSALDPATTEQILQLLIEVNRKTGVTVVLITHESEVVRRICGAAALMEAGRIVEQGRLIDLVADPVSPLAEILLPTGDADVSNQGRELVLSFVHDDATQPTLSHLSRDLGIDVSILGGTIETIADHQVGRLRVMVSGPQGDVDQDLVTSYLAERGVSVRAR